MEEDHCNFNFLHSLIFNMDQTLKDSHSNMSLCQCRSISEFRIKTNKSVGTLRKGRRQQTFFYSKHKRKHVPMQAGPST